MKKGFLLYKGKDGLMTMPRVDLVKELGAHEVVIESLEKKIMLLEAELQEWENWHDGQRQRPPRRREIPNGWRVVTGKQV